MRNFLCSTASFCAVLFFMGCGSQGSGTSETLAIRPSKPTHVTVKKVDCNHVKVSWVDNSSSEDGFTVSIRDGAFGGVEIARTDVERNVTSAILAFDNSPGGLDVFLSAAYVCAENASGIACQTTMDTSSFNIPHCR